MHLTASHRISSHLATSRYISPHLTPTTSRAHRGRGSGPYTTRRWRAASAASTSSTTAVRG
eukprot:scaffold78612_cov49-Phaeocystis_antarctica.AAC.2